MTTQTTWIFFLIAPEWTHQTQHQNSFIYSYHKRTFIFNAYHAPYVNKFSRNKFKFGGRKQYIDLFGGLSDFPLKGEIPQGSYLITCFVLLSYSIMLLLGNHSTLLLLRQLLLLSSILTGFAFGDGEYKLVLILLNFNKPWYAERVLYVLLSWWLYLFYG